MKNLIIVVLLGISAHSAMAEVITIDHGARIKDEISITEDFHFTLLNTPHLEYGSAEVWLQGMMIFNFFIYPEPISLHLNIEASKDNQIFSSSFVSINFPCGHFGDWAVFGFFPTSSSDSNIQECGNEELEGKAPSSVNSITIDLQPIPEPGTQAMILLGLMLMGWTVRKGRFGPERSWHLI